MTSRDRPAPRPLPQTGSDAAETPGEGPPLVLDGFLAYRLSRLAFRVTRALAVRYGDSQTLSHSEWKVLSILADSAGLTGSEIAARSTLDRFAVSKTIKRLRTRGLLRSGGRIDGRALRLAITPAGWAVYAPIAAEARAQQEALTSVLTAAERQQLFRILDKLDARADAGF